MAIQATRAPMGERRDPTSAYDALQAAHPALLDEVKRLRAYRDRQFARLTGAPGRDRHSLTRKLIRTPALHRLYAFEGLRKARQLATTTPARVAAIAEQCKPLQQCDEPSSSHYVNSGTHRRLVTVYGPAKRGRQMMVADLLRHLHPPLGQQYLYRGGMPAAFRAVEAAFAEGFTWGVEVDFVGFYGSVGLQGLAELLRPLPESVVNHVIWDRALTRDDVVDATVPTSLRWAYPSFSDRLGIALGSACSPMVGERILAMLIAPTADCRTVAYADNVFVAGRSREAVSACVQAMRCRAATFDGWSLEPREAEGIRDLTNEGFDFLHHEVRIDNGQFTWSPDYRKLNEYSLAHSDDQMLVGPPTLDAIAEVETKIAHWRRAYPQWPDGDVFETTELAALAAYRYYLAASPLNRTNAANALVASYFANGRRRSVPELTPTGQSASVDRLRESLIALAEHRIAAMATINDLAVDAVAYRG